MHSELLIVQTNVTFDEISNEYLVHLDLLSPAEIQSRRVTLLRRHAVNVQLDFSAQYANLPEQRMASLCGSLNDRAVFDTTRKNCDTAYRQIYQNYCFAHTSALSGCAPSDLPAPAPSAPSPYAAFYESDAMIPRDFKITCLEQASSPSSDAPSIAPLSLDADAEVEKGTFKAHLMVLAANSPYFQAVARTKMQEMEKREIKLNNISLPIAQKVVRWMYDHAPIQVESDEEAYGLHQVADQWRLQAISEQTLKGFQRHQLTMLCPPDALKHPDALSKEMDDCEVQEIIPAFIRAKNQVELFTSEYLSTMLPTPAVIQPASASSSLANELSPSAQSSAGPASSSGGGFSSASSAAGNAPAPMAPTNANLSAG